MYVCKQTSMDDYGWCLVKMGTFTYTLHEHGMWRHDMWMKVIASNINPPEKWLTSLSLLWLKQKFAAFALVLSAFNTTQHCWSTANHGFRGLDACSRADRVTSLQIPRFWRVKDGHTWQTQASGEGGLVEAVEDLQDRHESIWKLEPCHQRYLFGIWLEPRGCNLLVRILYAVAHPCRKNHQCQIVHLQVAPGCACITIIFQPCFATVGGGGIGPLAGIMFEFLV